MIYSEPDTDITVKSVQDSLAYDNKPGGVWEQVCQALALQQCDECECHTVAFTVGRRGSEPLWVHALWVWEPGCSFSEP